MHQMVILKKEAVFNKVLSNIGVEKTVETGNVWQLKDVMYSSSADVIDIIINEMIRLVSNDDSISASEKNCMNYLHLMIH